jgi:hypothetical protein
MENMRILDKYTMDSEAATFYTEAVALIKQSGAPFILGGGMAVVKHTNMERCSKDLDIFVKPSDYMSILQIFSDNGFEVQVYDVRWLAKIFKNGYYIDLIFSSVNNICRVDDSWFARATEGKFGEQDVLFLSAEDLIWCKSYIWNRERFDGADINHLLLSVGETLDWKYLLDRLDPHWHLLLAEILLFQFVYPNEYRRIIPQWLFDDLMARANQQYQLPAPLQKVCRGPLIDNTQYSIDIKQLDYKSCTIMTI